MIKKYSQTHPFDEKDEGMKLREIHDAIQGCLGILHEKE